MHKPIKSFNVGETIFVKYYMGGILHPSYRFYERVITKVPGGSRKRYQVSGKCGPVNRWPEELYTRGEVMAMRLRGSTDEP
jgi:hypothetical protein